MFIALFAFRRKYDVVIRKGSIQSVTCTSVQQIAIGYIQISSMVSSRYVLVPFCQLPVCLICSIVPIGIPLVCEKHVLYIVRKWNLKVILFGDWHPSL